MHNPNGIVIYEGPSMLTGDPIVAIATGLTSGSANGKTGAMVQTWILDANIEPHIAVKTGEDSSVCGTCPFSAGNGCYVRTHQAPLSVFRAYHRGIYAAGTIDQLPAIFDGRIVRLGAYGDPAAVPFEVWESVLTYVPRHTGYTHQWRTCDQRFSGIVMASVERLRDVTRASAKGYRAFYVRADGSDLDREPFENRRIVTCPASAEAGHRTTCENCGLCDGTYALDKRAHIAIAPHGSGKRKTATAVMNAYA